MCDTLAATATATAAGIVLFGKNSDREYDEAQYLELLPAARHERGERVRLTYQDIDQVRETHAVLLSKPHWIWGAEIGANDRGLVIGNEAIFSPIEASAEPGIIGMDYLRLALERAADVDEAIAVITSLLHEHGQGGNCGFRRPLTYHNSFILADPKGAKVLETIDREWVARSIDGYCAISNAITISTDFEASSPTLKSRAVEEGIYREGTPFAFDAVFQDPSKRASGHFRRARAMELLQAGSGALNAADVFQILRDHREGEPLPGRTVGPRICSHSRENPLGQTTASWVSELTAHQRVHWVTGTAAPCTGLFKPVLLECGLPQHGPKPKDREDEVSLWWRHERVHRALDTHASAMREGFIVERVALEGRFRTRMEQCPKIDSDKALTHARNTVELCWREGLEFEQRWYERLVSAGLPS